MNKSRTAKILFRTTVVASVSLLAAFSATETPQLNRLRSLSITPEQQANFVGAAAKQNTLRETKWKDKAKRVAPRAQAETLRQTENLSSKLHELVARPQTDAVPAAMPHVSAEQHAQVRALNSVHQASGGIEAHFDNRNGTLSHLALPQKSMAKKEVLMQKESAHIEAKKFLAENRALLKMEDPDAEVKLVREQTDASGQTHLRFQQTYRGVPLFGKELMVHMNSQREVSLLQGKHEPTPAALNINPAIGADVAITAVFKDLGLGVHKFAAPSSELLIYTSEKGVNTLAYKVVTKPAMNQHWIHFVDAQNGKVIDRIDNIQGAAVTASGTDLNGQARSFTAWAADGGFYLIDPNTPNFDAAGYDPVAALIAGRPRADSIIETAGFTEGSSLNFVTSNSASVWDPSAVSASYNTKTVFDYYKNTHGRNSIDDKNSSLQAVIHFGNAMDNAFWNGTYMVYGDGGAIFKPLAGCLDVAAHEMTHGVIENTAGLIYVNQSGALNESFADVFGAMVDRTNWTVGDGCVKNAAYLRNLAKPSLSRNPQPSKMSEYRQLPQTTDGGGVHINSGIPNRAAYLLAEGLSAEGLGTSIGREKTEKIYYRALTTYLLQSSQFIDARRATIKAAQDLYPADAASVAKAWDVVQVTDNANPPAVPTSTDTTVGSDLMVYLTRQLIPAQASSQPYDIWVQKMAAPFAGYDAANDKGAFNSASLNVAHKRPAVFSKVSSGRILTRILYVDTTANIQLAEIDPVTLTLVSARALTPQGGFNSISVSPDARYIAYTTTSATDNNIHIIDGNDSTGGSDFDIALISPNYQTGATAQNTVLYADSLNFDYSGRYIVFDALNCISLPNNACSQPDGGYRYWSVGRADLPNKQVQFLLPSQDPALDIGNPVFASNNRNIIALDVIDSSDPNNIHFYVASYDLERQTPQLVWDLFLNGLDTGSQPSFWGNDDFITFVAPDATYGRKAYRIAVDANGVGKGTPQEVNALAATAPIMHRAGVRALTGTIALNVTQLDFGSVAQANTKVLQFTLSNTGNSDVSITSLSVDNLQAFNTNLTNGLIPRGTTATFDAIFSPTALGTQTGNL
ncbi:MAG: hypothetical protein RL020_1263, partial [Pseudomonadota bacterium]